VSHVINYDIPMTPDDYVHRIGRTGRAAATGDAFTIATPQEANDVRSIERFIKASIPQLKLEDFDYKALPPPAAHRATALQPDYKPGRTHGQRSAHGQNRNGPHSGGGGSRGGKPGGQQWRSRGRG